MRVKKKPAGYAEFSDALRRVLQAKPEDLKARIAAEKKRKSKPSASSRATSDTD